MTNTINASIATFIIVNSAGWFADPAMGDGTCDDMPERERFEAHGIIAAVAGIVACGGTRDGNKARVRALTEDLHVGWHMPARSVYDAAARFLLWARGLEDDHGAEVVDEIADLVRFAGRHVGV